LSYDDETLSYIYNKTGGCCRYCGKKLSWSKYAVIDARGAWEVDHGIPLSKGGTDYLQNLWPACLYCNRMKGDMTSSEFKSYLKREYGIG